MQATVLDPFSANYLKVSWVKVDARAAKREERGPAKEYVAPTAEEIKAANAACETKTQTRAQARIVNDIEDSARFEDFDRQHQSGHDRIFGRGYVWDGWRRPTSSAATAFP